MFETKNLSAYRPLIDEIFGLWMGDVEICTFFLNIITKNTVKVKEVHKQKSFAGSVVGRKRIYLDILTENEDFRIYNIEAQQRYLPGHKERCIFHGCRIISEKSLEKGEDYEEFRPVTVIFINRKNKESNNVLDEVCFRYSAEPRNIYSDVFKIIEVNIDTILKNIESEEIPDGLKFLAVVCEFGNNKNTIMRFCENLKTDFSEIIDKLAEIFDKMIDDASIYNDIVSVEQDDDSEFEEEEYPMLLQDILREEGKSEGKKEGKKEGRKEGKIEGKLTSALSGLNNRIDLNTIIIMTGFSRDFLKKLEENKSMSIEDAMKLYYKMNQRK